MAAFFNTIVNMSITGSIVIAAVIIIRFLIKRLPKKYSYLLWSVVAFRLCIPVSVESIISIFQFKPLQAHPNNVAADSGVMTYVPMPETAAAPPQTTQPIQNTANVLAVTDIQHNLTVMDILPYVWLAGALLFALYGIASYIRLSKKLSASVKYIDNIYQSDCITSPFIFGIIKPKIYIPFNIKSEYLGYIISHEKYHIKRLDYLIKLFAFFVLAVHWFNPLCWLAFYLMNKDMEMSCDERVLGNSINTKKNYSYALLSFATDKKFPAPSPLCFGEGSAKSRIQNILKYKKPTVAVTVTAVILCLFVLASCATNPKFAQKDSISKADTDISSDYKAYAVGDCIGESGYFSAIIELNGYAYVADNDLFLNLKGSNEYFNNIYKSYSAIEEEITESELKKKFDKEGIIGGIELPDFKSGKVINYYDFVESSTPSYSVYVFDNVPYMLEYAQRYFLLTFDEDENKKLSGENYFSSLVTLSDSQRKYIDTLFNTLENPENPLTQASSNPGDYINDNEEIYETLVSGRFFTMQYIVEEFSKGNQTGLKGHLMRDVMDKIIGSEALKLYAETGQEYFDAWSAHTIRTFSQSTAEDVEIMKSTRPYSYWYFTNYRTTIVADGFKPFDVNGEFFKLSRYGDTLKYDDATEFSCTDSISCSYYGRYFDLYKSHSDMSLCAFIDNQLFFRNVENNILYRMPVKFYGSAGVKADKPVPVCDIGYVRICHTDDNIITICDGSNYYDIKTKSGKILKSDFNSVVSDASSVSYAGIGSEDAIEKAKGMSVDINNYINYEYDVPDYVDPFDELVSCELIFRPDIYGYIDINEYNVYPRPDYAWRIQLKNDSFYSTALVPLDDNIAGGCIIEKSE